nr:MAG TPA: hypothetical protein [Caudoviricetes sp.]
MVRPDGRVGSRPIGRNYFLYLEMLQKSHFWNIFIYIYIIP